MARGPQRGRGHGAPSLRRRILLLLIPGIACILLALAGAALIDRLQDDERDEPSPGSSPSSLPLHPPLPDDRAAGSATKRNHVSLSPVRGEDANSLVGTSASRA